MKTLSILLISLLFIYSINAQNAPLTADKQIYVYVSSTTTQTNTGIIRQGSSNQQIIGIQIVTTGNVNPDIVSSFTLNTNGSTNASDIVDAKVYYTGTSSAFTATNQFGANYSTPAGSFSIVGSQVLAEGTNYFWLTYDISLNAAHNDLIDAECNSIIVNDTAKTPAIEAPEGFRTIKAALTGGVTVGSTGDYPTITGAGGVFEAINNGGLKGNTTVLIVSNTFETGAVALSQWYEAGGSYFTLTIQPDAAEERVVSGGFAGGLIRFSGADRVTIDGRYNNVGKYLAFANTATSGTIAAIQLIGTAAGMGCADILIRNCRVSAGHNGSGSYAITMGGATVGSGGYDHDQVAIQNCILYKAGYGIYSRGSVTGIYNNLVISDDSVGSLIPGNEVKQCGIYLQQCAGAMISGNTVFNIVNGSSEPKGIQLSAGCINSTVSGNMVTGVKYTGAFTYGGSGIYVNPGYLTANISIINNIVTDISGVGSMNLAIAGIRIENGAGIALYYNSVSLAANVSHATAGDISAAVFIGGSAAEIILKNNIFRNSIVNTAASALSYAIYSNMPGYGFSTIDYNDYFAGGIQGRMGYCDYANATTITQWRMITSQDGHSIGDDPLFASHTDLHFDYTSPARYAAAPVTGITSDFENAIRNDSTPSMGALETPRDSQGPEIIYSKLPNTALMVQRTLIATITDATGVPVSGPGLPVLYWNINHGAWNASAGEHTGDSSYKFTFGFGVSISDSVFYFIAAQDSYSMPSISVFPSAGAAGFTANPPDCSTKPANPDAYKVVAGLSGTLTVGIGANYPNLTGTGGLFETINQNIMVGNVDAVAISDLTEPGNWQLYGWLEEGAGTYSLTVSPEGATERLISGNVDKGLITLNGANRVTISGAAGDTTSRYFRIRNTNNSYPVIHFLNGAQNNTIRNCHIESELLGITFGASTVFSGNSHNQILFNAIHNRTDTTGIQFYGIYSLGTTANPNHSNTIRGNEISNYSSTGINITGIGNGGEWVIAGNSFFNNLETPPSTLQRGINFVPGWLSSGNHITGNYIGGQLPQCEGSYCINSGSGGFSGISINAGSTNNYIQNNTISNIFLSDTTTGSFYGIVVNDGWCSITNNIIGNTDTAKSIRNAASIGLVEGISVRSAITCNVSANLITNFVFTATSGNPEATGIFINSANVAKNRISGLGRCANAGVSPTIFGLYLYGNAGATNEIVNNSIALDGGSSADPNIFGVYDFSGGDNTTDFYYNSVSIEGTPDATSQTAAIKRDSYSHFNIRNNALANFSQAGSGGVDYCFYFSDTINLISDFNDLYCANGSLGLLNGDDIYQLADWRTASIKDAHSISLDPLFKSNTNNLHPHTGSPLGSAGIGIPEVTDDIDDMLRDPVFPTIGCYEKSAITNKTWNGTVSSSWNNPSNWTPSGVPMDSDNLTIPPATPFQCILSFTGLECNNITVRAGATITLNSGSGLAVFGNFIIENGGNLTNDGVLNVKRDILNLN